MKKILKCSRTILELEQNTAKISESLENSQKIRKNTTKNYFESRGEGGGWVLTGIRLGSTRLDKRRAVHTWLGKPWAPNLQGGPIL